MATAAAAVAPQSLPTTGCLNDFAIEERGILSVPRVVIVNVIVVVAVVAVVAADVVLAAARS